MLRRLAMQCPQCQFTCRLHLSNHAPIVIISCPSCCSPLMHFGGKVYMLTEEEMDAIRAGGAAPEASRLLWNVIRSRRGVGGSALGPTPEPRRQLQPVLYHDEAGRQGAGRVITHDDIIDLRIELGTCTDSAQFIEKMR